MSVSCVPRDLAAAASCYCYGDQKIEQSIIIYLLKQIAGDTSTPKELAAKAACYCYSDSKITESIQTMLLCNIATAAGA